MNTLIVYAHPEPKSFNGAMKDLAVETLRGRGDNVEVTDLYAMKFKAVVGADDFQGKRADPDFLSVATEQTRAYQTGTLASDIVAEQKKVERADLIILQFPIWWFGMPAILKGYCGLDVIEPFVAFMPGRVGAEERKRYLDDYKARLLDIENAPRLFFHSGDDYGPNERLKPGVIARSGVQRNV